MDVWDGPPREGTRGGLEQFRWDSIKDQKYGDREQYLGHSTKIGLMGKGGRFVKNDWWTKAKKDSAQTIGTERSAVKNFEEELMQEALGLKPKNLMNKGNALSEDKMKELLKRSDEQDPEAKGLGFAGFGASKEQEFVEAGIEPAIFEAGHPDEHSKSKKKKARKHDDSGSSSDESSRDRHRKSKKDAKKEKKQRRKEEKKGKEEKKDKKSKRDRSHDGDEARSKPSKQQRRSRSRERDQLADKYHTKFEGEFQSC
eukprot:GDKH01008274.1.p1 GENE.GDKH01008274.1~~GDKH01008274.1.p1  ORF type:complete len:256 (+),score=43.59 GDKH01008274.1:124-891(+)